MEVGHQVHRAGVVSHWAPPGSPLRASFRRVSSVAHANLSASTHRRNAHNMFELFVCRVRRVRWCGRRHRRRDVRCGWRRRGRWRCGSGIGPYLRSLPFDDRTQKALDERMVVGVFIHVRRGNENEAAKRSARGKKRLANEDGVGHLPRLRDAEDFAIGFVILDQTLEKALSAQLREVSSPSRHQDTLRERDRRGDDHASREDARDACGVRL